MKKNIAIVYGGYSAEAGISSKSAQVVKRYLSEAVFNTYMVEIRTSGWFLHHNGSTFTVDKNDFSCQIDGQKITFDGVFMAIHGTPGEDGTLQSYFELIGIKHNTSASFPAAITFDKGTCNSILKQRGIQVAESYWYTSGNPIESEKIINKVGLPCFVKPNRAGSSFGISKVKHIQDLVPAIQLALEHDSDVIIEAFVNGTEVTCGCINFIDGVQALPITEIVSEGEFFDYSAKYEGKSQEITPARIKADLSQSIQDTTERIYKMLNLNGMARIDYIIQDNIPYVIEINTVPGLSEESIIPQQAREAGISLEDLFAKSLSNLA